MALHLIYDFSNSYVVFEEQVVFFRILIDMVRRFCIDNLFGKKSKDFQLRESSLVRSVRFGPFEGLFFVCFHQSLCWTIYPRFMSHLTCFYFSFVIFLFSFFSVPCRVINFGALVSFHLINEIFCFFLLGKKKKN